MAHSGKTSPITPLADRIVATKEKAQTQTAGGLYLPDSAKEKPVTAVVNAIGSDVKNVKVGDRILYKEYTPTEVKFGADEYIIVKEEDVLGTLE